MESESLTAPGHISQASKSASVLPVLAAQVFPNNDINVPPEPAEVLVEPVPILAKLASVACFPLALVGSCYTVNVKQEVAVMHCGQLTQMESRPGLHCTWACGREIKRVSTKQYAKEMPSQKIADASGNPVIVSAIVNYSVTDAKKAILNVQDVHEYVNTNAQATLKQVVSTYTYDQLKSMGAEINTRMRLQLAPWLEIAGVDVASICLNDLSYAPEVAAAMLKKQQAVALVQARELIVEGAVKIAQDAVQRLETDPDQPLEMDMDTRSRIITNILTVTCSESNAMPTLSL